MVEIRWHGRGGQGVVTAAKLLAAAAMREGRHIQAFPEFGPERRGAPLQAFTRIDDEPVRLFSHVGSPNVVVVLDRTLIRRTPFTRGLVPDGVLVVNSASSPKEIRKELKLVGGRIFTVDATRIAMDTLGRPIANTAMMGAVIKAAGMVGMDALSEEIRATLGAKIGKEEAEANVRAVERAARQVRGE